MQEVVDRLTASDPAADVARTLLLPYLNHAATMYESGYATSADIDASMRFGCGYPIGPLALVDALGAQTVVTGLEKLYAETGDELHQPAAVLTTQAAEGTTFAAAADADGVAAPQLRHEINRVGVVGTGTMASASSRCSPRPATT